MNLCSGIDYKAADRSLNVAYQKLMPLLTTSDQKKLIVAQQAWIKFRDASCDFERNPYSGGSVAPLVYNNCLTYVTNQRTKDLERYLYEVK